MLSTLWAITSITFLRATFEIIHVQHVYYVCTLFLSNLFFVFFCIRNVSYRKFIYTLSKWYIYYMIDKAPRCTACVHLPPRVRCRYPYILFAPPPKLPRVVFRRTLFSLIFFFLILIFFSPSLFTLSPNLPSYSQPSCQGCEFSSPRLVRHGSLYCQN